MSIIVKESERLTRLINDILDLAKMEAGTSDWHMADLAPRAVIEQALAATAGLFAKARHISLETRIAADLLSIRADADRLTQVIVNLISNAVKFCAQTDGRIELEAWQDADFLRVDVKDNGVGIAKADQQRIFERFQQAGNTLTDKPQGTGLGLPISRQILQRFGGKIWVESEPGKGASPPSVFRSLDGGAGDGSGRARSCARLIAYEQKLSDVLAGRRYRPQLRASRSM